MKEEKTEIKKVDEATAKQELNKWLDYLGVDEDERGDDEEKGAYQKILKYIMQGRIKIDENFNLMYELKTPVTDTTGNMVLDLLTFKPRITNQEFKNKFKGFKSDDAHGILIASMAASTNQNTGILSKMTVKEYNFCTSIVSYFL